MAKQKSYAEAAEERFYIHVSIILWKSSGGGLNNGDVRILLYSARSEKVENEVSVFVLERST